MTISEERVDRRLGYLRSFMESAWSAELSEAEALLERVRVELMLGRMDAATKQLYRAAVHYLEEAVEHRHEKEGRDRLGTRQAVTAYLKLFLEGLRN